MSVRIGSGASIAFGIGHFFAPAMCKGYAYIDAIATQVVIAVRATTLFSLSLVLFGAVILLIYGASNRYSLTLMLAATCVLWITRLVLQLIYPQGSMNPFLQYGMLLAFLVVFICYVVALFLVTQQKLSASDVSSTSQRSPLWP